MKVEQAMQVPEQDNKLGQFKGIKIKNDVICKRLRVQH